MLDITIQDKTIPEDWTYAKSVKKMKVFVYKWKNMTGEMFHELWVAREVLDGKKNNYGNQYSAIVPNGTIAKTFTNYCEEAGISTSTAHRWLKWYVNNKPHIANNSNDNEWYTPVDYIDLARSAMGSIDLDPASNRIANNVIRAGEYYTKDQNGLSKKWFGNVFLNPPYAQPLVAEFSEKVCTEYTSKNIKSAIVLVNNATETQWFQSMANISSAICFPERRVKFWKPDSDKAAPLQGQAFLYFGEKKSRFTKEFSNTGIVYERI